MRLAFKNIALITGFGLILVCTASALALWQPRTGMSDARKPAGPPSVTELKRMLEVQGARSADHDLLETLSGSWNVEAKIWIDPPTPSSSGSPPIVSRGTMNASWILGKRYVQCQADIGTDDDLPSQSVTIYGYDTKKREYTVMGMDTYGTSCVMASGVYDPTLKVLTLDGRADPGKAPSFRWMIRMGDSERIIQEVYAATGQGTWVKVGEAINVRAK